MLEKPFLLPLPEIKPNRPIKNSITKVNPRNSKNAIF
jgi:hypothetical protein